MDYRIPLALLALTAILTGCGSASPAGAPEPELTVVLDFIPNAVHAGIYVAHDAGFDRAAHFKLNIRKPSSSTDSVKLLQSGRADAAVLDIEDLMLARERGSDLVAVLALTQRPLAAIFAQPWISRPRELQNQRVGITGTRADSAIVSALVNRDGGDGQSVHQTMIGFDAVKGLCSRRLTAAIGFRNAEGITLRRCGRFTVFAIDHFGAPRYPELVLAVTRNSLIKQRRRVKSLVQAVTSGYKSVIADRAVGVNAILKHEPELSRAILQEQMAAVERVFSVPGMSFGEFDGLVLQHWANWITSLGLPTQSINITQSFDGGLLK